MADQGPIYFFKEDDSEWGFLCQWYKSSFTSGVTGDGENVVTAFVGKSGVKFSAKKGTVWRTAEQYMMWHKAVAFSDYKTAREILHEGSSPRKCKALGKSTKNFDDATWDRIKSSIVEEGSYLKFTQGVDKESGRELKKRFLETGDRELVEASPFDRIWGVGFSQEQLRKGDKGKGEGEVIREWWGENRLGKALMVARKRIGEEEETKEIEDAQEGSKELGVGIIIDETVFCRRCARVIIGVGRVAVGTRCLGGLEVLYRNSN